MATISNTVSCWYFAIADIDKVASTGVNQVLSRDAPSMRLERILLSLIMSSYSVLMTKFHSNKIAGCLLKVHCCLIMTLTGISQMLNTKKLCPGTADDVANSPAPKSIDGTALYKWHWLCPVEYKLLNGATGPIICGDTCKNVWCTSHLWVGGAHKMTARMNVHSNSNFPKSQC